MGPGSAESHTQQYLVPGIKPRVSACIGWTQTLWVIFLASILIFFLKNIFQNLGKWRLSITLLLPGSSRAYQIQEVWELGMTLIFYFNTQPKSIKWKNLKALKE